MSDTAEALAGRPVPRMTEAEYERERTKLRAAYGDSSTQAAAKRDQAMALLFARSGWTQEELAKKERKSQQHIARSLRFGRFLNTPMGVNANGITERLFRDYWERTSKDDGSERERFEAVQAMIANPPPRNRKPIGPAIVEHFADGEWHHLKDIAEKVADGDEKFVAKTMENALYPHARLDAKAERRKYGKSYQYRIFRDAYSKAVSLEEVQTKLGPLIKRLYTEGRKNMVTMSPGEVLAIAHRIDTVVKEWTGSPPSPAGTKAARSTSSPRSKPDYA